MSWVEGVILIDDIVMSMSECITTGGPLCELEEGTSLGSSLRTRRRRGTVAWVDEGKLS